MLLKHDWLKQSFIIISPDVKLPHCQREKLQNIIIAKDNMTRQALFATVCFLLATIESAYTAGIGEESKIHNSLNFFARPIAELYNGLQRVKI